MQNGAAYTPTRRERTYLPVLYHLAQRDTPVIAAQVVRWLGVTPPTVTQALQQFAARGLIQRDTRGTISLTPTGMALAETMVRRHRILECFLADVVGIAWSDVHQEALQLEHVISPAFEARITALVGAATTCPHGNPIPGCAADRSDQICLDQAAAGSGFTLQRVTEEAEQNTDLLYYLAANLLLPGTRVHIVEISSRYGVTLRTGSHMLSISPDVAAVLWGKPATLTPDRPRPDHTP